MLPLTIAWETNPDSCERIRSFICSNITPEYIASGEILLGFAADEHTWSPEHPTLIHEEIARAIADGETLRLATARMHGALVATCLIEVFPHARVPHALLYDFLVASDERSCGVGAAVHAWVEAELRGLGIRWISLESGVQNTRAHAFFMRNGFEHIGDTYMKRL